MKNNNMNCTTLKCDNDYILAKWELDADKLITANDIDVFFNKVKSNMSLNAVKLLDAFLMKVDFKSSNSERIILSKEECEQIGIDITSGKTINSFLQLLGAIEIIVKKQYYTQSKEKYLKIIKSHSCICLSLFQEISVIENTKDNSYYIIMHCTEYLKRLFFNKLLFNLSIHVTDMIKALTLT